jgi:3-oxoacyl-[acyl-carrier protein] reductase
LYLPSRRKYNLGFTVDLGLKGATALVTGASAGLGLAVASMLAAEGCRVAICSRSKDNIEAAAGRLRQTGGDVIPVVCDVTSEDDIRSAMDRVSEEFSGSLNILVTNSGGPPAGYVADFDADDWRRALELNLLSTINLTRHGLPLVRSAASDAEGFGRILMITSVSAKQPIPSLYLSNVSRAGVQGFAKSLSEEVGPEGITVNTVLPGYTMTERLKELADAATRRTGREIEAVYDDWAEATAVKRLAEPEEFGAAVAFLASRHAGYITGLAFPVDGGRIKGLM